MLTEIINILKDIFLTSEMNKNKKIFIYFFFTIYFSLVAHGCYTGSIAREEEKRREGERLVVIYYKNFKADTISVEMMKYLEIDYKMKGHKKEYKDVLIQKGYVEIQQDLLCRKNNGVIFKYDEFYTYVKYDHDMKECNSVW